MQIKEMFEKDIDRDIKGVIKVGQDEEENKYQELNEYVVTKELLKHFREFFKNYEKSIDNPTDEIGVWISGFFGSGKSHFLKILSYILENKKVNDRRPVDFFSEDNKIQDQLIIANMESAANIDTDVILFNIDAKNPGNDKNNAIMKVFIKVFNEMQGFAGEMPFLADFEKKLVSDGKYEEFKIEFKSITGESWVDLRNDYYFKTDEIIKTIVNIGYMSEDAARNWTEKAEDNYNLSIENFAEEVNNYLSSKGPNHRIIFLVDEIGQFIGDDTDLMLNLQTITEQLGMKCNGKAWIVVTSQQNIDDLINVKGQDFSKIQGRFNTRLSLSSANVDEVIRKRILQKNEVAKNTLEADYPNKEALIKNLISFKDTAEMKKFASAKDYVEVYPFIPYQFNLLQSVLTSIREHGASGKHLSEGERSMLALFKESAQVIENEDEGALIPFNIFYRALEKFIDHSHSGVIIKASDNDNLSEFDVEILKTLFMIKYVKEIKANIENITTLMINNVNEDRISLKEKIEKSLNKLIKETLIQKNGEVYSFLTNEEQDINRAIKNEIVELGEILNEVGNTVFEDIIGFKRYNYTNRYNFLFNQAVDNKVRGHQKGEIGVRVITSYYENLMNNGDSYQTQFNDNNQMSTVLKTLSDQKNEVILHLNGDDTYLDEISESLKISKFLKKNPDIKKELSLAKQEEYNEKGQRIKLFLEEAIKTAEIYIGGRKVEINEKNPEGRINESLEKLVIKVYNKLSYMEFKPSKTDILTAIQQSNQDTLFGQDNTCYNALNDLENFIDLRNNMHENPNLKTIIDHFSKAPYGFKDEDTQWLVSKLFSQHRITLIKNAETISLNNYKDQEILNFITSNDFKEKILVSKKKEIIVDEIKAVKNVLKDVFGVTTITENAEKLMSEFKKALDNKSVEINTFRTKYQSNYNYPGKDIVENARELFMEVNNQQNIEQFYKLISKKEDDFLDIGDKLIPITDFFGNQVKFFEEACDVWDVYNTNESLITDDNIIETANNIKDIIDMSNPYSKIKDLPQLCNDFNENFNQILEEKRQPIKEEINSTKKIIMDKLNDINDKSLINEFQTDFNKQFDKLFNKLEESKQITVIDGVSKECESVYNKCFVKIDENTGGHVGPTLKVNNILLKSIAKTNIEIKNDKDIDDFLNNLKQNLKNELDGYDIVKLR